MRRTWTGLAHRDRDESGAIAIFVAGGMVAMLVITAMVLDFGLVRLDRQQNKATADAAATAGAVGLTGDKVSLAGACAAIDFLKANNPALAGMTYSGSDSSPSAQPSCSNIPILPCDQSTSPATPKYHMVFTKGTYRVEINTPYTFPPTNVAAGAPLGGENYTSFAGDKGSPDGCDQVQVVIKQTRKPGLGSLATSSELVTQVASVARGVDNPDELLASVAVLLERTGCAMSVGGSGGQFIIEETSDHKQPGFLHSDSDGSSCSKHILIGQQTSPAGIQVNANTPPPGSGYAKLDGIIQTRSGCAKLPCKAIDGVDSVVRQCSSAPCYPAVGTLAGRTRVDQRYRSYVIRDMKDAVSYWRTEGPASMTLFDVCNKSTTVAGSGTTALLYCGTYGVPGSSGAWTISKKAVSLNYQNVILDLSSISISGNSSNPGSLSFPGASKVYMTGSAGTAVYAGNFGSFSIGSPFVGTPSVTTPTKDYEDACNTRPLNHRVKFILGSGGIGSASAGGANGGGGKLNLCHTSVITLGGDWGVGTKPPGCVPDPAVPYVWPAAGSCAARINLSGVTYWSAPNELRGALANSSYWQNLEDLAYWNESTDVSNQGDQLIQSAGADLRMAGLFFTPNSTVNFGGNSGGQLKDAQFIALTMTVSGSAVVRLTPNEYEMVLIPASSAAELMR